MTAPIALTCGDPAGIGPQIALRAWAALRDGPAFFLLGSLSQAADLGGRLGIPVRRVETPAEAAAAMARGLPVLDHPLPRPPVPGCPDPGNAPAVVEIIARAVRLVQDGAASALCTAPISKAVLKQGAGFAYPGHTEYLAALCGVARPVMMLAAPGLRVVPVTIHIPLAEVPAALTADLLEQTLRVTHAGLAADFGLARPRIAIAGLNPHAGESGTMGREEIDTIVPVLDRLRAEGMALSGPHSADTLFHPAARARYDAAVCMYHDQALIAVKTLDFDGGVNVTLGLDIVRTSPDHGTAFDIAPALTANPASLIAALGLADAVARTREIRS
jgi:4-hydroxythreonine-4-phosphate dehydrogenase